MKTYEIIVHNVGDGFTATVFIDRASVPEGTWPAQHAPRIGRTVWNTTQDDAVNSCLETLKSLVNDYADHVICESPTTPVPPSPT